MIVAEVYSDDNAVVVPEVVITEFFAEATEEQIRKTLLQLRSGTPPDELQHYLRQKAIQWEGVTNLLAYCDARNCFPGEYVSFNVSVDIAELTNWLVRNRPSLVLNECEHEFAVVGVVSSK